jgi:hypothetical protein
MWSAASEYTGKPPGPSLPASMPADDGKSISM